MTTPPPNGDGEPPRDGSPHAQPSDVPLDFDPYRYGAPEHPIPPEYAPPGYVPPPTPPPSGPQYPSPYGPGGHPPTGYPAGPGQPGNYGPPPGYPAGVPTGAPDPRFPHPYAPAYNPYPQPRAGNGKAIASLVCGILSIILCLLTALDLVFIVPAIVFGIIGRRESLVTRDRSARSLATAGLICGVAGLVLAIAVGAFLYAKVHTCLNNGLSSSQVRTCVNNHI